MKKYIIYFATNNPAFGRGEEHSKLQSLLTRVADMFGGYTLQDAVGGYTSNEGKLVEEKARVLTLFINEEDFEDSKKTIVSTIITDILYGFNQESVMLEENGKGTLIYK